MLVPISCPEPTTWEFKLYWKKSSTKRLNLALCINTQGRELPVWTVSPSGRGFLKNSIFLLIFLQWYSSRHEVCIWEHFVSPPPYSIILIAKFSFGSCASGNPMWWGVWLWPGTYVTFFCEQAFSMLCYTGFSTEISQEFLLNFTGNLTSRHAFSFIPQVCFSWKIKPALDNYDVWAPRVLVKMILLPRAAP